MPKVVADGQWSMEGAERYGKTTRRPDARIGV